MGNFKDVLVIGSGPAGLEASVELGRADYSVILAEKENSVGGCLRWLDRVYPSMEKASALLGQLTDKLNKLENVEVLTSAYIEEIDRINEGFSVKLITEEKQIISQQVKGIIIATGLTLFNHQVYGEYGYGKLADVLTAKQMEKMLQNKITRPSDGSVPKRITFIHCVGSRDKLRGVPYCSSVCCMTAAKLALLAAETLPQSQISVFYHELRTRGKNGEEFIQRAYTHPQMTYIRGKIASICQQGESLVITGADTLSNSQLLLKSDLVVLACGFVPLRTTVSLAEKLNVATDTYGFIQENNWSATKTTANGIFAAGSCTGPKDIAESMVSACASVSQMRLFLGRK